MIPFYIHDGTYLIRHGNTTAEQLKYQANGSEILVQGEIPGYVKPDSTITAGFKWHVRKQQWVDTRTEQETAEANLFAVMSARRSQYPPIEDLADALVHQANGNTLPLQQYIAACIVVKEQNPKP